MAARTPSDPSQSAPTDSTVDPESNTESPSAESPQTNSSSPAPVGDDDVSGSTAARALAAAGDAEQAKDVGALDEAALNAQKKLGAKTRSLVERLIYGPAPDPSEFRMQSSIAERSAKGAPIVEAALQCLEKGQAFEADRALSTELRRTLAKEKTYGFTVAPEFGGLGGSYPELACIEEELSANGLGALAVEVSGELTIGAGSLQAYGTPEQKKLFLPLIAEGQLMGFGLTEVRIGVNAKKVRAYVEWNEEEGQYRLQAAGDRNKLYITNATYGSLVGIVARVGRDGKRVGLFIIELPPEDVIQGTEHDYSFSCSPSGVDAFVSNFNSRLHFENFPIRKDQEIQADGVEVLFYCLRMGRCMLSAMSAGYQRMFAADASHYAIVRRGVGGPVIKHELPRLALSKMLGGALQARSLSHLSLDQDHAGVDLAGLRDLTKSAAATTALESLIACERVLGGRSFDSGSRVSEARSNIHVFGVVEGEDDLILMGMVKDITGRFIDQFLAGLLGVLQDINLDREGKPLPKEQRILRIGLGSTLKYPARVLKATGQVLTKKSFWGLAGWVLGKGVVDVVKWPLKFIPASFKVRHSSLPAPLQRYAYHAERRLAAQRWVYLGLNLFYQLELTRSQIPLQRFGKRIEHLTSMLALVYHAADQDESIQRVAEFQAERLRQKAAEVRVLRGVPEMERFRRQIAEIGSDLEKGQSTLVSGVKPEPYAHPWDQDDTDRGDTDRKKSK